MQRELSGIEKNIDTAKKEHCEVKGTVQQLRRRLGKIQKRREEREDWTRRRKMEEKQQQQQQQRELLVEDHQRGKVKGVRQGPIATISNANVSGVATYVGKSNTSAAKKDG